MAKDKKPTSVDVLAKRGFRAKPHNEDECISVAPGEVVELSYENHIHVCAIGKATADPELVKAAIEEGAIRAGTSESDEAADERQAAADAEAAEKSAAAEGKSEGDKGKKAKK